MKIFKSWHVTGTICLNLLWHFFKNQSKQITFLIKTFQPIKIAVELLWTLKPRHPGVKSPGPAELAKVSWWCTNWPCGKRMFRWPRCRLAMWTVGYDESVVWSARLNSISPLRYIVTNCIFLLVRLIRAGSDLCIYWSGVRSALLKQHS